MGSAASRPDRLEKERSAEIDRALAEAKKNGGRESKALVLGSPGSGKTTIANQMKIILQGGFSDAERAGYRAAIFRNVVDSARQIAAYTQKAGLECVEARNRHVPEMILAYQLDAGNPECLPMDIVAAIHQLWTDPICQKIMDDHLGQFQLVDSAPYFFAEILRIGAQDYVPTEADILRVKEKSSGIEKMKFEVDKVAVHLFDVSGQRGDPRKWIHCFESVETVIFCISLSEYDEVLPDDKNQSRLTGSLALLESVVNSRWFGRSSIILFLTKFDVFQEKLKKVPLEDFFPEYTDGPDAQKAAQYILSKCEKANRARLTMYPHFIDATDSSNFRVIFTAVQQTLCRTTVIRADEGIIW